MIELDQGAFRRAGADESAEMQVQVGAELQPPVWMRDRQRTLDVVRHRLGRDVAARAGAVAALIRERLDTPERAAAAAPSGSPLFLGLACTHYGLVGDRLAAEVASRAGR